MQIFYALLCWSCGHACGCRLGAKWRLWRCGFAAHPIFVGRSFFRFCLLHLVVTAGVGLLCAKLGIDETHIVIASLCSAAGLITGFAHGHEEYSPF